VSSPHSRELKEQGGNGVREDGVEEGSRASRVARRRLKSQTQRREAAAARSRPSLAAGVGRGEGEEEEEATDCGYIPKTPHHAPCGMSRNRASLHLLGERGSYAEQIGACHAATCQRSPMSDASPVLWEGRGGRGHARRSELRGGDGSGCSGGASGEESDSRRARRDRGGRSRQGCCLLDGSEPRASPSEVALALNRRMAPSLLVSEGSERSRVNMSTVPADERDATHARRAA
ncbi:MAG: hypothetical protein SGPRY_013048, partial [Prymnesium sp.]